jgi:hypothetical protein
MLTQSSLTSARPRVREQQQESGDGKGKKSREQSAAKGSRDVHAYDGAATPKSATKGSRAPPAGPRAPNHAHKHTLEKDEPDVRSHLAAPHVESFNYFINEGLPQAVKNLLPVTLERPNEEGGVQRLVISISSVRMSSPIKSEDCKDPRMLPSECRHLRLVSPRPDAQRPAPSRVFCGRVCGNDVGMRFVAHACWRETVRELKGDGQPRQRARDCGGRADA